MQTAQQLVDHNVHSDQAVLTLEKTARRKKDLLRAAAALRARRFVTDDRRTWLANQYLLAAFHHTDVAPITPEQEDWFARMAVLTQADGDDAIYARLLAGIPGLADVERDVLSLAREPLAPGESRQSRMTRITHETQVRTAVAGPRKLIHLV